MVEIRNQDGKLIATIHDVEDFSGLVDEFERQLRLYHRLFLPQHLGLGNNVNFVVNQNFIDNVKDAARHLREIRQKFGDTRDNLYPVEIPGTD